MPVIQLDSIATAKLRSSSGPVNFVDEQGEMIGRYQPVVKSEPFCPWDPEFTLDDAEHVFREGGGSTIEDFWKQMGVK